jgi:ATP-dependent Lhr-like helicase
MIRIKDLPDKPTCPKCGSSALGVLSKEEDQVWSILEKKSEKLTKNEEDLWKQAQDTAKLVSKYGKPAAAALAGRRLKAQDVEGVLSEEKELTDRFYELVMEAERKALRKRF